MSQLDLRPEAPSFCSGQKNTLTSPTPSLWPTWATSSSSPTLAYGKSHLSQADPPKSSKSTALDLTVTPPNQVTKPAQLRSYPSKASPSTLAFRGTLAWRKKTSSKRPPPLAPQQWNI